MIGTKPKRITRTGHKTGGQIGRLPYLAAATFFFLGLSTNTHLDAAPGWPAQIAKPQSALQSKPNDGAPFERQDRLGEAYRVLSARDADLYRAAFTAQAAQNWARADDALALIKDKRLTGHVLADRYLRRPVTLAEAQSYMKAYAAQPEAEAIYDKARMLHGFAAAHMTPPAFAASWANNAPMDTSFGFRAARDNNDNPLLARISRRINDALHRGDAVMAREMLTTEMQRGTVSNSEAGAVAARIAAALFHDGQIERARPVAHMAAENGAPLGLWIDGLAAWKQQDYAFAQRSFASLAQTPGLSSWDRAAAAYWAYRGAKRVKDEAQAHYWLAEAAKYPRTFYGMMAVSQTGQRADLGKMPELTPANAALIAQNPHGWQALALLQTGKADLAEAELRRLNLSGNRDLQTAALALAEKAHLPSLSLQLSGLATNDNGQYYQAAQYPVPPWQPADGFKVDRALLYALIKRESQFDPEAVSQSGACGLMQLMPSTARLVANDNGGSQNECPEQMFDPAVNMAMGQKYVRVLAGQPMIGNNLLLLLAAYNGGPGNLARWMDNDAGKDPLLFIESLPMRETRDYVQQVLLHYWMYRARLAEPETTLAQLARGEWPRYALNDNATRQTVAAAPATPRGFEMASR